MNLPDKHNQPLVTQNTFYTFAAPLLLMILFAQTITSIPRLSITSDEDLHVVSGYSILRTGDLRLIEEHPALIKLWMSWPLLLSSKLPNPQEIPGWAQGNLKGMAQSKTWQSSPIDSWLIPSRIPIPWLALLLGTFLFRWASDWFGRPAGLFALALLTFDPNILAHATVATIDLGVTCFIFIAMYGLQRLFHRPSRMNLAAAGIALGLALASKVSALILLPISLGLMLTRGLRRWRKIPVMQVLVYLGVAFLTLWAIHRFEFGMPPEFSLSMPAMGLGRPLAEGSTTISVKLPFPVPIPSYLIPFSIVGRHVAKGSLSYLLGETYRGGRWYYFPVVFALKTPLPTLILIAMAIGTALRRSLRRWRELVLMSFPVSYFATSLFSSVNLGYRHLLPILPFLYLFVAQLVSPVQRDCDPQTGERQSAKRTLSRCLIILALDLLLLWQAIGTLITWPFYLTFFNEIAGGSRNGYRYLADSNVDWGQGLKALRVYLEERHWTDAKLSSFSPFIRPQVYGIQAIPLPPLSRAPGGMRARFNPASGVYVISASTLRGLQTFDPALYNWFWHREPDDMVANAMLVYKVSERTPTPTWVAQCTVPIAPLDPEQIAEGFGRSDLRLAYFDCSQSWLYPTGGQSPGWVMLAQDAPVMERYLASTRLSYVQQRGGAFPSFRIYEDDRRMVHPSGGRARAAPSAMSLADALTTPPLDLPVTFNGLTLLGYTLDHSTLKPGETVSLETAWRVDSVPERLPSLMAHVLGPDGRALVVGDGLGVPIESWQADDIFVQRHTLTLPGDMPPGQYWVQTGIYWLDSGERWPVRDSRATGDRLLLESVQVKR